MDLMLSKGSWAECVIPLHEVPVQAKGLQGRGWRAWGGGEKQIKEDEAAAQGWSFYFC